MALSSTRRHEHEAFQAALFNDKDFDLTLKVNRTIRKEQELDPTMATQLEHVMKSCYWGDAKTIQDCFNWRHVDDGIMGYKEIGGTTRDGIDVTFSYWGACFGGNSSGYLLRPSDANGWETVVENCDGDFMWRGGGGDEVPTKFVKCVKKTVMGKYYDEDE